MTARTNANRMQGLLERAGVPWAASEGTEEEQGSRLASHLEAVAAFEGEYLNVFGRSIDLLTDMEGDRELDPLIQTFAIPLTANMRMMVYCILKGGRITKLSYEYEAERSSRLRVEVAFADGTHPVFESDEHWDALVLHQLGIAKVGGRPLIDSYLSFRPS